jgi:prepilin-type N-terminal cleavage/methylation domain-containing protein
VTSNGSMGRRSNIRASSASGFTLIEVLISVVLLAAAFTTVAGLQSASISATIRSGERQRALLLLRQILSVIETNEELIEPQVLEGAPSTVLAALFPGKAPPVDPHAESRFSVTCAIEPWSMPSLPKDTIRRMSLTVRWGDDPRDRLSVLYFIPTPKDTP